MPDPRKLTPQEQIQVLEVKIYQYVLARGCIYDMERWDWDKEEYQFLKINKRWARKKILQAYTNLFDKKIMDIRKCGYDSFGMRQSFEALFKGFVLKWIVMKDKKLQKYI